MKKNIIAILIILCILLLILGTENRVMFGVAVCIWPILFIAIFIVKVKMKDELNVKKSKKAEKRIEKGKSG